MNMHALRKSPYLEVLFLVLLSGLVYLPYIPRLSYLLDEWYFIYDGVVAGPNVFHAMFSIDRPARGYFFDAYFSLFGPIPFPYHVGAYLWRLFAGLCALWLFRTIWTNNRRLVFFSTLLFMLYPGYSWWVSAIEYQPHIASLALQVFSFVMTLEAIKTPKYLLRILFVVSALVSGWAYIALVEYAIGMELFRFLCVYLFISHRESDFPVLKKVIVSIQAWSWSALVPLGFLVWRSFFFENQRRTTDIGLMISKFRVAPVHMLGIWTENTFKSFMNSGIYAWYKPFQLNIAARGFQKSYVEETVLAIVILALLGVILFRFGDSNAIRIDEKKGWKKDSAEAIFLGLASLLFGIFPVVFANRYINLSFYSHYSPPISLAAAVLLTGLISYLVSFRPFWNLIISMVVMTAGITHSLLAQKTIVLEQSLQQFWWQASWRIPDLRPDSTIVTLYPYNQVVDNELGLAYPPNLIYFPEGQSQLPVRLPVSTLMPTDKNVELILTSARKTSNQYRTHRSIIYYTNILVLVQPTPQSCVRVIGGENTIFSDQDPESIRRISGFSKMENIRLQKDHHTPPEYAFGPEPVHSWCFFFEKADLAVQRLDWQSAAELGDQVLAQGLEPADVVEWLPFIQAYAMLNNRDQLKAISEQTKDHPSFEKQFCEVIRNPTSMFAPTSETRAFMQELFCH